MADEGVNGTNPREWVPGWMEAVTADSVFDKDGVELLSLEEQFDSFRTQVANELSDFRARLGDLEIVVAAPAGAVQFLSLNKGDGPFAVAEQEPDDS